MKIYIIIVMILCIGAFFIISQNNLHMNESANVDRFFSLYTSWIGKCFQSVGSLTAHVIRLEWLPKN